MMAWLAVLMLGLDLSRRLYTLCASEQDTNGRIADVFLIVVYALAIYGVWLK